MRDALSSALNLQVKKNLLSPVIVTTSSPFFSTMIKQNGLKSKPVQLLLAINWPSRSREKSGPTALFTFDVFSAGRGRDGRRFTSWNIFSIEGIFFFASIHPVRLFSDVWRNMKNSRMGRTRRIKRQQSRARVFRRTLLVLKNVWSIGRVCPASSILGMRGKDGSRDGVDVRSFSLIRSSSI